MDQWPDLTGRAGHAGTDRPRRTAPRRGSGTVYVQPYRRTGENCL